MSSAIDLVLRDVRIAGNEPRVVDIGIRDGRIAAVEPHLACEAPAQKLGGRLVVPGFVETHIHLDKSHISDRCTIRHGTWPKPSPRRRPPSAALPKRIFTRVQAARS